MKPAPPVISARMPVIVLERSGSRRRPRPGRRHRAQDTGAATTPLHRPLLLPDTPADPGPGPPPALEWESGNAPAFRCRRCASAAAGPHGSWSAPRTDGKRDPDRARPAGGPAPDTTPGDNVPQVDDGRPSSQQETAVAPPEWRLAARPISNLPREARGDTDRSGRRCEGAALFRQGSHRW